MSIFTGLNMWQFDEGKCHICQRVFCCGKCRSKHQFNTHAIAVRDPLAVASAVGGIVEHKIEMESGRTTIYVFCPICERKPLMLCEEIYAELLEHIETAHLPLRCRKCQRNYTKISDLREFSKCVDMRQECSGISRSDLTANTDASKVTVKQALALVPLCTSSISTQTSPGMTPISLINMRWKAKSRVTTHEEMISDSVSSIRNISSISNGSIRRSIGQLSSLHETVEKGKVIRSTSTPVQLESMFAKPKEPLTFNASNGGHVSSIYQEEASPALEGNPIQQQQQQLQQRPWKMGARSKMTAVTPLRQVMSKSIQKAFVEHGAMLVPPPTGLMQRRVRLDLSDNNNYSADGAAAAAAGSSALDLRLSPVVRRTQSESSSSASEAASSLLHPHDVYQRQFMLSAQKLTTESIIITRTMPSSMGESNGSTVYNSCESVEIIRSTSESAEVHVPPITPITRVSGAAINKKQIKFETPHKSLDAASQSGEEESKDTFYTPNPGTPERRRPTIVPRQISGEFSPAIKKEKSSTMHRVTSPPDRPRARPPLRDCHKVRAFSGVQDLPVGQSLVVEEDEDDVFLPTNASTRKDKKRDQGTGRLWSIMSTMMRLPATLRGDKNDRENNETSGSGSLIRRCASIAGSLVRTSSRDGDDGPPLKRKRTQTLDNNLYCTSMSPSSSSKRYRIRPREPIERMRHK